MPKKVFSGVVRSARDKTIVVTVEKKKRHPKYRKITSTKHNYHAHDPESQYKVGDFVTIVESKPISKMKKWIVLDIKIA